jgi:hypothetical protein
MGTKAPTTAQKDPWVIQNENCRWRPGHRLFGAVKVGIRSRCFFGGEGTACGQGRLLPGHTEFPNSFRSLIQLLTAIGRGIETECWGKCTVNIISHLSPTTQHFTPQQQLFFLHLQYHTDAVPILHQYRPRPSGELSYGQHGGRRCEFAGSASCSS